MSSATQIQDIRPEFPSSDAIAAYGALCFLYMHSPRHAGWTVQQLRRIVQPPIDLRQAKVFYYEDVPRAACIWAHLDDAAEQQVVAGQPITPAQWRSGPKLWLMEIIAPYEQGTGARAFRGFMENIPAGIASFRYQRLSVKGEVRRIVESTRLGDGSWGAKTITNMIKRS